ncbi:MAG: M23 family metallopeptidase [Bacillota bacterium]|nr:M23 family metallopeptidase [Bacillota bacterium]MDW7683310.1 M23 family metallopeptidase [Bacillota bacterium]
MRKKKKWKTPHSSLRERLEQRAQRRHDSAFFSEVDSDCQKMSWENLPAALMKPMREQMFQKTIAAVIVVICLGIFSLVNVPATNRFVDAVHYLTVYQMNPAELVDAAKPVVQSVRDFDWRRPDDTAVPEQPPADEEQMAVPVNGVLASPYGSRLDDSGEQMEMHYGIDVVAEPGSPVYAAFSGTISLVQDHPAYGMTIYIEHPNDLVTIYGRVAEVKVQDGEQVTRGQELAVVAAAAEGESHLHFEIWEEKQPVNPEKYLTDID